MENDIFFMPLGGGQGVGASCYFLKLGGANIILDAGTRIENGLLSGPDFYSLITSPFIQSLSQINQIYISHAHTDHIGCLPGLIKEAGRAEVFMTEITAMLSEYQLYDKTFLTGKNNCGKKKPAARNIFDKVTMVSYMQTMDFGRYRVTFLAAGHIPGAMMVLFECGKRKILYTGDYSLGSTTLAGGCMLPDNPGIDTVIMCGLHAKHPGYRKKSDRLYKSASYILKLVKKQHIPVMCYVPQLSKSIEFLTTLNSLDTGNIPIFIDKTVMGIVSKMEQLSVPVLNVNNRIMGDSRPLMPHIYITSVPGSDKTGFYRSIKVDFSLHEDFIDMKKFIKKINPSQAVIVHCARPFSPDDATIEQEILADVDCRTQFIFAEEREIYKL